MTVDIEKLKELAGQASEGPWQTELAYPIVQPAYPARGAICSALTWPDARFIAAANPAAVLELIAENEKLKVDLRDAKDAALGLRWAVGEFKAENEALRGSLAHAADEVESWGAYASDYFQQKHDLAGTVLRIRKAAMSTEASHD